jgi:hypothetical protein
MSRNIFLVDGSRGLVPMRETRYETEALLQELIARYPSILADDSGQVVDGPSLLLVKREAAIADTHDGNATFALDHHFVDASGVPVLVEVKRSQDTRIRREVIGQMLDYAARVVTEWTGDSVRADFEATCALSDLDAGSALREFLGEDGDPDTFWATVHRNLQARRIRLILVADEIPRAMQRVIEFLNEEMRTTEVIGIEIKRYHDSVHDLSTLVPRTLGDTARAKARKEEGGTTRAPHRDWDADSILATLSEHHGSDVAEVARRILDFALDRGLDIRFGRGAKVGAARISITPTNVDTRFVHLNSDGQIGLGFDQLKEVAPFDDEAKRSEVAARLEAITGVRLRNLVSGAPEFPMQLLRDAADLAAFLDTLHWIGGQVGWSENT